MKRHNIDIGDLLTIKLENIQESYRFDPWSLTDGDMKRIEDYNAERPSKENYNDELCIVLECVDGFIILMGKYFGQTSNTKKLIVFGQTTQQYFEILDFEIETVIS